MNRVYRLVRNKSTGEWVVASELAKGHGKGGSRTKGATIAAAALLVSASFGAQAMPNFDPATCDYLACTTNVGGGATVTLTGSGTQIAEGQAGIEYTNLRILGQSYPGLFTNPTMQNLAAWGTFVNPGNLGDGTLTVDDPAAGPGMKRTVPVYNTNSMWEGTGWNYGVVLFTYVGDQQYINARLGNVDSTGGTLNVDIGSHGYTDSVDNTIAMDVKQTYLMQADGTAGNASQVNWTSDNFVNLGPTQMSWYPGSVPTQYAFSQYRGTFQAYDGTWFTVNDFAGLKAYHDWLLGKVQANQLSYDQYAGKGIYASAGAELSRAYTTTNQTITWNNVGTYTPTDEIFQGMGDRAVIHAMGNQAIGSVASGVHLDVWRPAVPGGGKAAVMLATQGGTVVNHGTLGMVGDGNDSRGTALWAEGAGSQAINDGVLAVGYYAGTSAGVDPVNPSGSAFNNRGIFVNGGIAHNTANAVINVAGAWVDGIELSGVGGTVVNDGTINVGVTSIPPAWYKGIGARAISAYGGSVTNTGDIYLGRGAGYTAGSGGADVANGSAPLIGILADNGTTVNNTGHITIGMLAESTTGIYAAGTGAVTNAGTVTINGALPSGAQNWGMAAVDAARNVSNTGSIDVNGTNSIGLVVLDGSSASNTGTINLNGGVNANGVHNYGIYTEGGSHGASFADVTGGTVNLNGDGAIGVHARTDSTIRVSGNINFVGGEDQIGYFAYGNNAKVEVASAPAAGLDVTTKGSTLFRIENGATIDNKVSARLTASGENTTVAQVTGAGTTANLDNMDITVTGTNAVGVKLEGGATGTMSNAANFDLASNTTGIVIDDKKYDINGDEIVGAAGNSVFTNTANINVGGANVTAFVVKNGGELINTGNIELAHGTAVELVGAGSTITAGATRGTITVHDGVMGQDAGIYVHGGAAYNSVDAINVDGGAAGILVASDAGPVTVSTGAHIKTGSNTWGNLVVNQGTATNAKVNGGTLEMAGAGAALVMDNNLDPTSNGTIVVSGSGTGIAVTDASGAQTSADYTVDSDWNMQVTNNGSAVYADTTGDVTLDGARINLDSASTGAAGLKVAKADDVVVTGSTNISTTNANAILIEGNPLTLTNQGTLSAASINDTAIRLSDAGHTFVNESAGNIRGKVELGDGGNSVTLKDTSTINGDVVLGDSTNTATLQDSTTLNGTLAGGTGNDTVTVKGNNTTFTTLDGGIGGADRLILDGATRSYGAADAGSIQHFETVQLSNASTLTLRDQLAVSDTSTPSTTIDIDAGSTLAINPAAAVAFTLDNPLASAGLATTNTGGAAFAFGTGAAATGTGFTGTLALGNSTFQLDGDNTTALTKATLRVDANSVTTVGTGEQAIGGLAFNGGTVVFDANAPEATLANSSIKAGTLDATGTGTVKVNVPDPYLPTVDTNNTANLLEQDDGNIGMQLVKADTVQGSGGAIAVQDQSGNVLSAAHTVDIEQGGALVAEGTYDYGLSTAPGDGLYVNYGLRKLDLQAGQTLTLQEDSGAAGAAADMAAQIIGTGNLAITAGVGTVSLSNATNNYTGDTTVNSGTLKLDANSAMGQTNALHVANAATVDVNGKSQTIQTLDGQAGSTLNVNAGALTIANGGTSAGSLTGDGQLNLTGGTLDVQGGNAGLTADTAISNGATASLDNAAGLGAGNIVDNGTLELDGATGSLANAISGTGDVNTINAADVVLAGNNSGFSGAFNIDAGTQLTASSQDNLGTAVVADAGTLVLDGYQDALANDVSGTGIVRTSNGSDVTLAGNNATFAGTFDVTAGTTVRASTQSQLGTADIVDNGTVALNTASAFALTNELTGNGLLEVNTGAGNAFDFATSAGTAFAGTVAMGPGTLSLDGDNTAAMTNATLRVDTDSVTTVGAGDQAIHGLAFNGGTMIFDGTVPDYTVANSTVTVDTFDASGTGTVQIKVPSPAYIPSAVDTNNTANLLEQDDGKIGMKLVNATTVTGNGSSLSLLDQNGNTISDATNIDIEQGGNLVAKGTYDYGLDTALAGQAADGLYVTYKLTELDIQSGQTLALAQDTNATGDAADMSARITGTGNLAIDAAAGTISLSNSGNDYSGDTTVNSGTLRLDADNALGNTATLHVTNTTVADLSGTSQAIQQLDGQAGSMLNINGGTLDIANGGTSSGALAGAGALNVNGGLLDVKGANTGLSATTGIASGATAHLDDVEGLGKGAIADNGTLIVDIATDGALDNAITGTGDLVKQGTATVTAGDALTYTGSTRVEAGTLIVGDNVTPGITLGGAGAGPVDVFSGATLTGLGTVSGVVNNNGTVNAFNAMAGHASEPAGTFTVGGLNNNAGGVVNLAGGNVGNTLVVQGDYAGNGGTLVLNTVLGDDASPTDRLVVKGDTSGSTAVTINQMGDTGQYTRGDGIQIVQVDGASNGQFTLDGRVVAGAREYLLAQGGKANPADGDWYLRSEAPVPPACGDTNTCPPPVTPTCESANSCPQPVPTSVPVYRPEPGAYLGNQTAALGMFQHTLHDRLGEVDFNERQRANGDDDRRGAVWTRVVRNQFDATTGADQIALGTDTSLVQLGGEFGRWTDGDSRWQVGGMAAIGQATTHAGSNVTGYESKGTVKSQVLGVYGTWYANASKPTGLYLDSWVQAGNFDNRVEGARLARESYDAQGWAASLEAGYAIELGRGERSAFYLEPQAQVIVSDYRADNHREANGTMVKTDQGGGVTTRLGARFYARPISDAHNRVQPFVETNWWHHGDAQSITMDGEQQSLNLSKNAYEVKFGAQAELGGGWTGWGHLGFQEGSSEGRDVEGQLGVKYGW